MITVKLIMLISINALLEHQLIQLKELKSHRYSTGVMTSYSSAQRHMYRMEAHIHGRPDSNLAHLKYLHVEFL